MVVAASQSLLRLRPQTWRQKGNVMPIPAIPAAKLGHGTLLRLAGHGLGAALGAANQSKKDMMEVGQARCSRVASGVGKFLRFGPRAVASSTQPPLASRLEMGAQAERWWSRC